MCIIVCICIFSAFPDAQNSMQKNGHKQLANARWHWEIWVYTARRGPIRPKKMKNTKNMSFFSTPWKFNIAPENGWLEDEFPFGIPYFQGLC